MYNASQLQHFLINRSILLSPQLFFKAAPGTIKAIHRPHGGIVECSQHEVGKSDENIILNCSVVDPNQPGATTFGRVRIHLDPRSRSGSTSISLTVSRST